MIKFNCSKCGEGMEAPESLSGQPLQCPKCGLHETVPPWPPDITEPIGPRAAKKAGTILTRLWQGSPQAFRTAFLATLGVIAGLALAWRLYNFEIPKSSAPTTSSVPVTEPAKDDQYPTDTQAVECQPYDRKRLAAAIVMQCYYYKLDALVRVRVDAANSFKGKTPELIVVLGCTCHNLLDLHSTVESLSINGPGLREAKTSLCQAVNNEYDFQVALIRAFKNPSNRQLVLLDEASKKTTNSSNKAMFFITKLISDIDLELLGEISKTTQP